MEAACERRRQRPADQRPERGLLTAITLPAGVELDLYQPRHPTATQRAVPGRQGVIWIQLATEGTPSWLTRNSMYQPGGARLELAGTVAWTAPPP
jgi:hypothetical protein